MLFKSSKKKDICIVSGCDRIRFNSFVNHRLFANENQASYVWSFMTKKVGANPYLQKIGAVRESLTRYGTVFWIDDDAYFTDFGWRLDEELVTHPKADLIICKSPVNEGRWTWISSGQFFLRNSKRSLEFLDAVLATDPDRVKAWWDQEKFGLYTSGDQDLMVYVLATDRRFREGDFFVRLDYTAFNLREFHYSSNLDEHKLVHFASNVLSKEELLTRFIDRLGVNEFLVPGEITSQYDLSGYSSLLPKHRG